MARSTVWAPAAERDVGRIWAYLDQRSPAAADAVVRSVVGTVDLLADQPELGRPADDVVPVGRYRAVMRAPYRIVYRVTDQEILILRVWDTRRDPETFQVLEEAGGDE